MATLTQEASVGNPLRCCPARRSRRSTPPIITAKGASGCSHLTGDRGGLGVQALVGLFSLPLTDLIPRHVVEEAILVADPEVARREPPLDRPPDSGASAPTVRVAAALVVVRVVDPLKQRPLDGSRVAPIDSGRESAFGERVSGSWTCSVQGDGSVRPPGEPSRRRALRAGRGVRRRERLAATEP